jgi:predicted alpha/beta-hydrolase family hydrolase
VTAAVDGSSFKQQQLLQMLRFELRHFEKRLKKRRRPPPEHRKKDMCRQR